jgi:hypothetical protein
MTDPNIHEFDSTPVDHESFRITNDGLASWAMRKLMDLRAKQAENTAIAEAERQRIADWEARVNGKFTDDIAFFESHLIQYAIHERQDANRKTIETPYGAVKSRATQDKVRVVDEPAFIEWAQDNLPAAVVTKVTASLSALKESITPEHTDTLGWIAMTANGEIVPGVVVEPSSVNYSVEVAK